MSYIGKILVCRRRLDGNSTALWVETIFSSVAKLVDALKRSVPEGTENAERKKEALRLARAAVRAKYEEE